jgi:Stigma-specific protein, Stig1/IPT/TIG domain
MRSLRGHVVWATLLAGSLWAPGCGSSTPGSGFTDPDAGGGGGGEAGNCSAPSRTCNGACIDVTSDPANCGDCGRTCDSGSPCCGGICVQAAACSFAVAKVSQFRLYLSGAQWVTLTGAGFVKGMKVTVGDGRAVVRVLDDKTALILTPPAPAGIVDVRIDAGGQTATLKNAFQYESAGLGTPWKQRPLRVVRGEDPGIAVLQDGRVLIAGGTRVPDVAALTLADGTANDALTTAEIYTRATEVVTPVTGTMAGARWHDSAVTLMDGRVLVVGAACTVSPCPDAQTADLFDPTTNTFTPSKSKLATERRYTRAALMPDGRVLIASAGDPTLEIYDPDADTFTVVPHTVVHTFGFMVRLRDGRILFGGGDGGTMPAVTAAEIYDPDTNAITSTGALQQGRSMLTAHTLPDGRALVIGGASFSAGGIHVPVDSIEAFDPKTGQFTTVPYKLSIGRTWHASALVRDGTILVMGGYTIDAKCDSLVATVDQLDPVAGKSIVFDALPNANTEWTAVTLLDGSVLGVGGGACGTATALPDLDFLPGAPETK